MSKRKTTAILLTASLVLGGCGGNSSPKETEWNYESFMSELEESISAEQEYYRTYTPETTTLDVGYAGSGAFPETVSEEQPEEIIEEDVEAYIGEESDDNFTYDVYEEHAEVKKFIGKAGRELTIPDEYNGLPVTIIEANACDSNSSLTKLTIGANVEEIGYGAFSKDDMLLSVDFKAPEKLKRIGANSFLNCKLMSSFPTTFPNLEWIGAEAFEGSAIKEFDIPSGVKYIGDMSFHNCNKLHNLYIEEGVETIGGGAFYGTAIETLVIPDSVTEIVTNAFQYPTFNADLKDVKIGTGITELPDKVFSGCYSLENVTLPDGLTKIGAGAFGVSLDNTKNHIKTINIPENVTEIGASAFYGCAQLEVINLPDGLETIGAGAFYDCDSLKYIDIPDTVTTIGVGAFNDCDSLTEVTVPGSVAVIEQGTFGYCDSLKKVIFNEGVLKLDERVFSCVYHYDNITDVILPDSLVYADEESLWTESLGTVEQANMKVTYKGKQYTYEQKDELLSLING